MPHPLHIFIADTTARALLKQVEGLGYMVSVHHLPASLLGTVQAAIEMHAIHPGGEQFIVKAGEGEEYACACELAKLVGIDPEGW